MIVETIFSTVDKDGNPNFAPMGITWNEDLVTVRPFRDTRTYRNLISSGYGVANITDDVLAFVQCCLYKTVLPHFPAKVVPGIVFQNACSWREIEVVSRGGSENRAELQCRVLHKGQQREFLGFCRAGNAVIEATIHATRMAICKRKPTDEEMTRYKEIIRKTGNEAEKQAFQLVTDYIRKMEE